MQLIECSVHLLTTIFNILVAVPYFRPTLQSVLEKFLDSSEVYGNLVSRGSQRKKDLADSGPLIAVDADDPKHETRTCATGYHLSCYSCSR
jgi:hypothetical protein